MGYNINFLSQYTTGTFPEWFTSKYGEILCFTGGLGFSSKNAGLNSFYDFDELIRDYRKALLEWHFGDNENDIVSIIFYVDDDDRVGKVEISKHGITTFDMIKDGFKPNKIDIYGN